MVPGPSIVAVVDVEEGFAILIMDVFGDHAANA